MTKENVMTIFMYGSKKYLTLKTFGTLVLSLLIMFFASPSFAQADEVTTKDISSIEEPKWIKNAGMSKGVNHDRQDLGFILKNNTVLQVRQVNKAFQGKLKLRLLGNDSKKEQSIEVGSEWVAISGKEDLVPFIDTPFGTIAAKLEYKTVNNEIQNKLPIINFDGNEEAFFKEWDTNKKQYALIKGDNFQLLVPEVDKERVRKLNDFKSIKDLIDYYNNLFIYFNNIAGFDESGSTNKNSENRYFLKADLNGAGGAYYGSNWTANSESSVNMWLIKNNWGSLHEIAHGYQAGFDGKGMYTGEVSNNLFGVQYQYEKLGKEADKVGWLFNYGKKSQVDNQLYTNLIEKNGSYDTVNLREKLLLLTMLKQRAGDEAFTKLYQGYRATANEAGFSNEDISLPDLLNYYYSEHSKLDFTPALEKWGLTLDENQALTNRVNGYAAVASLVDVIPKNKLEAARQLVDPKYLINSNFEMVENTDIAALGFNGNLVINLKGEEIDALEGVKVQIKEGKKVVQEKELLKNTVTFSNVPNGVYSVEIMDRKMSTYTVKQNYVYVKESQNNVDLVLEKINVSSLNNQKVIFKGLGDKVFGDFQTDLNNKSGIFTITDTTPHSYFNDELYVSIKVKKTDGTVLYEKAINGTNAPILKDKFALVEGSTIEIYHSETKNRLYSAQPIVDKAKNTNSWVVTKQGLQNIVLQNNPEDDLIARLKLLGEEIRGDSILKDVPLAQSEAKKQLLTAIQSLSEPHKTALLTEYNDLFSSPNPEEGDAFEYTFKGLGNRQFATMKLSLKEGKAEIKTVAKMPHSYFDEPYASILIQNSTGIKTYEKEYRGNVKYDAKTDDVKLAVGDYITVYHVEALNQNRLVIQNKINDLFLESAENTIYKVEATGIKKIDNKFIPGK